MKSTDLNLSGGMRYGGTSSAVKHFREIGAMETLQAPVKVQLQESNNAYNTSLQ